MEVLGLTDPSKNTLRFICIVSMGVFFIVLIRTAWVCDDAYITYRTLYNLMHGFGLRWNPLERVQTFTHPLWLFSLIPAYQMTGNAYLGAMITSVACSIGAIWVFYSYFSNNLLVALGCIWVLILSNAFMSYSTSGLENPLSHLLIVLFLCMYFKNADKNRYLIGFFSLICINRMDVGLIFLLPLIHVLLRSFRRRNNRYFWINTIIGFSPWIAWEMFSLIYYGFLVPNTAYAKLFHAPSSEVYTQGWLYLLNAASIDPMTAVVCFLGCMVPFTTHESFRSKLVAIGNIGYIVYIVLIGGDFMALRFMSVPLLVSVFLIAQCIGKSSFQLLYVPLIVYGLVLPNCTLKSDRSYGSVRNGLMDQNGIADERAWYYPQTGLLNAIRTGKFPDHNWIKDGFKSRKKGKHVEARGNVGFFGYFAGPDVHVIDAFGVADPLLARMEPTKNKKWRIGHLQRHIPKGYEKSIDGENVIVDENIRQYYDILRTITQGSLFDQNRLKLIVEMNVGKYDYLLVNKPKKINHQKIKKDKFILPLSGIRAEG